MEDIVNHCTKWQLCCSNLHGNIRLLLASRPSQLHQLCLLLTGFRDTFFYFYFFPFFDLFKINKFKQCLFEHAKQSQTRITKEDSGLSTTICMYHLVAVHVYSYTNGIMNNITWWVRGFKMWMGFWPSCTARHLLPVFLPLVCIPRSCYPLIYEHLP